MAKGKEKAKEVRTMRMNQEKLTSSNGKDQLFVKTWLP
ncbi:alpha/beta hydrolase, partial [Listeria monocytogenes]|nr:alpha/beta hydrolase [Listeria monocytogenes]